MTITIGMASQCLRIIFSLHKNTIIMANTIRRNHNAWPHTNARTHAHTPSHVPYAHKCTQYAHQQMNSRAICRAAEHILGRNYFRGHKNRIGARRMFGVPDTRTCVWRWMGVCARCANEIGNSLISFALFCVSYLRTNVVDLSTMPMPRNGDDDDDDGKKRNQRKRTELVQSLTVCAKRKQIKIPTQYTFAFLPLFSRRFFRFFLIRVPSALVVAIVDFVRLPLS